MIGFAMVMPIIYEQFLAVLVCFYASFMLCFGSCVAVHLLLCVY